MDASYMPFFSYGWCHTSRKHLYISSNENRIYYRKWLCNITTENKTAQNISDDFSISPNYSFCNAFSMIGNIKKFIWLLCNMTRYQSIFKIENSQQIPLLHWSFAVFSDRWLCWCLCIFTYWLISENLPLAKEYIFSYNSQNYYSMLYRS